MFIPREGSLRLAVFGTLRIGCEPIAVTVAWNLILGIRRSARSLESFALGRRALLVIESSRTTAARLIHPDCLALNFTILAINAYGIFCSMGNRRLPFSPAYGATAFLSSACPFPGGYSPMWCLNAAK